MNADNSAQQRQPKLYRPLAAIQPTAAEVATWIGGTLHGPTPPAKLTGFATLDQATAEEISFVAGPCHKQAAVSSEAGLLITPINFHLSDRARIEVAEVWPAVAEIMSRLYPDPKPEPGVHRTAQIDEGVKLGKDASVGPFAYIAKSAHIGDAAVIGPHCFVDAGCRVGEASRLTANVTLKGNVEIGRRVLIHPGVVIGADGFKFELTRQGILKIPQVGIVIIEDDVEIGANTAIDRAFLHETRIGQGTKIDNLVQIAHNCRIGRYCVIAGCVGIAGSATIEDGCMIGGGVSVRDGITLGRGTMIAAGSGVGRDTEPGAKVMGYDAIPIREFQRVNAYFRRLPEFVTRLKALEKKDEG